MIDCQSLYFVNRQPFSLLCPVLRAPRMCANKAIIIIIIIIILAGTCASPEAALAPHIRHLRLTFVILAGTCASHAALAPHMWHLRLTFILNQLLRLFKRHLRLISVWNHPHAPNYVKYGF